MPSEHRVQAERIRSWTRYVVDPVVIRGRRPLAAAVWPAAERQAIDAAEVALTAGAFRPVTAGHRWGPVWSTLWFHLTLAGDASPNEPAAGGLARGSADDPPPSTLAASGDWSAGDAWALRFSSGTEALWWDGPAGRRQPRHGFDSNRDLAWSAPGDSPPIEPGAGGILIEAACNHWFGIGAFAWDPPESQRRWQSDTPGTFEYAELVRIDTAAWRLRERVRFACDLLESLDPGDIRGRRVRETLGDLTRRGGEAAVESGAAELVDHLDAALAEIEPGRARTRGIVVGHAHIDTAWLWPMDETRRKLQRTFSNVLRLMERRSELRFTASSACHYQWVMDDAPRLFERMRQRVAERRWEPIGAAWIEFDANLPGGESMIRQILHGTGWFRAAFGPDLPQRVLFLPDTFGFPGTLPQIMRMTGLDVFVSNKLAWNRRTEWGQPTFRWRGIDGSEVLAHMTPGGDYNARLSVAELQTAERRLANGAGGLVPVWLQPFGFGDGGGGPDEAMLERADLAGRLPALPELRAGTVHDFAGALEAAIADRPAHGPHAVPVHDGGLPLELHRGTFTTHGRLKRAMRQTEAGLRRVEWLLAALPIVQQSLTPRGSAAAAAVAAAVAEDEPDVAALRRDLPMRWRAVMLNQFHDILPGTSIDVVGRESLAAIEAELAWTEAATERLQRAWLHAWGGADVAGAASDPAAPDAAVVVFNEHAHAVSGVIDVGGRRAWAGDVPGLGAAIIAADADPDPASAPPAVTAAREAGGHVVLDNGILRAVIGPGGRVHSLHHAPSGREVRAPGAPPLNRLELFEDHPHEWDAWELDPEVVEHPVPIHLGPDAAPVDPTVDAGGLRAETTVRVALGEAGTATLVLSLDAGSPRLDVRATIEWTADKRWLRVTHDVDVQADHAEIEVPFGAERIPTTRRTDAERMRFEVCGHRWLCLAETDFGVAIVNDGRAGHAAEGRRLSLSLLRAPRHPDPTMDAGVHRVGWAIVPFTGSRRSAGISAIAADFAAPLRARPVAAWPAGRPARLQPLKVDTIAPGSTEVAAWVPTDAILPDDCRSGAETSPAPGASLLRLVETGGGREVVRLRPATAGWTARYSDAAGGPAPASELIDSPASGPASGSGSIATDDGVASVPMEAWRIRTVVVQLVE